MCTKKTRAAGEYPRKIIYFNKAIAPDGAWVKSMSKLVAFLRDVKIELARVSWPTRKQTIQYTLAVIVMSLAVAAFLGALDAGFGFVLNRVLLK